MSGTGPGLMNTLFTIKTDKPRRNAFGRPGFRQIANFIKRSHWDYMEPQVGTILEGKVTTITKFGAFIALEGGKSGLVHISEIANTFVNDVHDFLQEGQSVKVLVLSSEGGKINLSIKKAQPSSARPARQTDSQGPLKSAASQAARRSPQSQTAAASQEGSVEDKLRHFLSSSEGKIADLNRGMDGRRGGKRRR